MIIVNFKNYKTGKEVLDLVRKIDIYCNKAIIAIPFIDLKDIVKETTLPVYAQHVDHFEPGRSTGYIIPKALVSVGVQGSLLNHAEHRMSFAEIKKTVDRCNEVGLKLVICAKSLSESKKIAQLRPYAIAFEDSKLIGTGKSITAHKTNYIKKFVESLNGTGILPLCGAGITSGQDVAEALVLGCKGVLVSSAVANAESPEKFLKEVSGLF